MPLLDDIVGWSVGQPIWQRDALRRLFLSETLTEDDLGELLHLLKADHGAAEPKPGLQAIALSATHVPSPAREGDVRLLTLDSLMHVNGFPPGRSIGFSRNGMTVVFGPNGSGKSGYARVLKNACRARHREPVRPNVFIPDSQGQQPCASGILDVSGTDRPFTWQQDGPIDPDLSRISVYDAKCGSDYIEEEGAPAFQPYGMGKVLSLAKACSELEKRIRTEISVVSVDRTPFNSLRDQTAIGQMIQSLDRNTNVEQLAAIGTLSDEDKDKAAELAKSLAEADPEPKARTMDRLATRLDAIARLGVQAQAYTTSRAIDRLKSLAGEMTTAIAAQEAAKGILVGDDLLPGTGSEVWRALFNAAESYSNQLAYPEHNHPNLDQGAKCVLCQSMMDIDTRTRMRSFASFVGDSTSIAATTASSNLQAAMDKIGNADFTLGVDETLAGELAESAPELLASLTSFTGINESRRKAMVLAVQTGDWNACSQLSELEPIDGEIASTASTLRQLAISLREAADPALKVVMQNALAEFKARQAFSPHLSAALQFVENSKKVHLLEGCLGSVATGPISRHLTSIADTYITDALVEQMRIELEKIGYHRSVLHRIPRRTDRGVTLVRVALEGTTVSPELVLSEGEQRAFAFAFFLAELHVAGGRSALVLDDPVTSMDHFYRKQIAARLAAISAERQVIVLTHDSVFLMALHRACSDQSRHVEYRTIEWDTKPGLTIDGLGWDNMPSGQRMNELRRRLSEIRSEWSEYPTEENKKKLADAYTYLRGALERIIREDMINGVVQPYSDEVAVERFGALVGIDANEWDGTLEVYDRACEATKAHDTTREQQIELPTPNQLEADIEFLSGVIHAAKDRRRAANDETTRRKQTRMAMPS